MRRFLPKSFFGQTVLVLLLGLTVSHVVSMGIYSSDRIELLTLTGSEESARRIASIARLVDDVPPEWRGRIIDAVQGPNLRVEISPNRTVGSGEDEDWRTALIQRFLVREVHGEASGQVAVRFVETTMTMDNAPNPTRMARMHSHMSMVMGRIVEGRPSGASLRASIRLSDGMWLNFGAAIPDSPSLWSTPAVLSMALMALTVVVFSVWAVRRMTNPLRLFAGAAERLGRDVRAEPLAEDGPTEIRQASRAFNKMQKRVRRLVENRTRMLAAISHDLRTPITQLRLRAEFIEDEEEQSKTLATLEEMEAMISSTLSFAREDAREEEQQTVDLSALIASICDDLEDTGLPIMFEAGGPLPYRCRQRALKRAITNLIENAVKYGGKAEVSITEDAKSIGIAIDDKGPGIEADEMENVFAPFYRVEKSRAHETGGVGLGLSVARSIVNAHGGEIRLENRTSGGLRASIELPK
jgi:signal transduction histidine kinase